MKRNKGTAKERRRKTLGDRIWQLKEHWANVQKIKRKKKDAQGMTGYKVGKI